MPEEEVAKPQDNTDSGSETPKAGEENQTPETPQPGAEEGKSTEEKEDKDSLSIFDKKDEDSDPDDSKDKKSEDKEKEDESKDDKDKESDVELKAEDLKFPEGMEADQDSLNEFVPLAKELNLSKENAQKLVDVAVKNAEKIAQQAEAKGIETWANQVKDWLSEARSDKEIGGSKEKFNQTVTQSQRALEKFDKSGELKKLDKDLGLLSNKAMLRFLVAVDNATKEDRSEGGGGSEKTPKTWENSFYGKVDVDQHQTT